MPWVLLTRSIAKSVGMRIPRLFRTYALSSDASAELVPQTAQLSASEGILPGISLKRPTRILVRLDHLHLTLTQCYLSVDALACLPRGI